MRMQVTFAQAVDLLGREISFFSRGMLFGGGGLYFVATYLVQARQLWAKMHYQTCSTYHTDHQCHQICTTKIKVSTCPRVREGRSRSVGSEGGQERAALAASYPSFQYLRPCEDRACQYTGMSIQHVSTCTRTAIHHVRILVPRMRWLAFDFALFSTSCTRRAVNSL